MALDADAPEHRRFSAGAATRRIRRRHETVPAFGTGAAVALAIVLAVRAALALTLAIMRARLGPAAWRIGRNRKAAGMDRRLDPA